MLIDSHAHIDGPEYDADREEVLARAQAAGVGVILTVGTGEPHAQTLPRAVALAQQHPQVYAAAGVHPHDAKAYDQSTEELLHELMQQPKVLAWGEIGLDYYYDHTPRQQQREVFARQLQQAAQCGKPVIIHTREADADTLAILREAAQTGPLRGVMHCFGGGRELLEGALALDFYISWAGNITFKKATHLREMAQLVPLTRLLVETDCPYLTPVPYRGKRNEPCRVKDTAHYLAQLRGLPETLLETTVQANFERLFEIKVAA